MSLDGLGRPTSSLEGKVALVTGGGRGIGRGISLQLARKGIKALALTYVTNKHAADETAAQCLSMGAEKVVTIKADVLDPDIGTYLVAETLKRLNASVLDIVINNAAIVDMSLNEPFELTTLSGFNKVMQGNCYAPISIIQAALSHLPKNGRIINISSIASRDGPPNPLMAYGASKAALDSFTRSLAMTYARKHLATFNSISVGATRTEAMEKAFEGDFFSEEWKAKLLDRSSAEGRLGEPEDVAMIVAWLASEESRWINGASVMAHGGDRALVPVHG